MKKRLFFVSIHSFPNFIRNEKERKRKKGKRGEKRKKNSHGTNTVPRKQRFLSLSFFFLRTIFETLFLENFTEINSLGDIRHKMFPPLESGTITRHYTNQTVIFMSRESEGWRYNCITRTSRTTSSPPPAKPFVVSIAAG